MRILCISQNLPGLLEPIASLLAGDGGNTVLLASMRHRMQAGPASVRRIVLKKCNVEKYEKTYLGYLELAMRMARNAANAWDALIADNFSPDLILSCASNGIAFCARHKFEKAFIVDYADPSLANLARVKNGMLEARRFISEAQRRQADAHARLGDASGDRAKGLVLPYHADLEFFRPGPPATQKRLLVFCGAIARFNLNAVMDCLCRELLTDGDLHLSILAANALQPLANPDFLERYPEGARARIRLLRNPQTGEWREAVHESATAVCLGLDACSMPAFLQILACGLPVSAARSEAVPEGLEEFVERLPARPEHWRLAAGMEKNALPDGERAGRVRQALLARHDQAKILPVHLERIFALMREKGF